MTVSTELSHEEYVGNGVTTDFDFRFRIFESKHLIVVVADSEGNETTLKNGTDYTIVGAGSYHGGKVVLNKPLAQDWKILLERDLPVVQETDLRNQGKFFAEVHEDAFDYLTMLIQKALGTFSLSLRKPTYLSNYYDAKGNRIANLAPPKLGTDSANKDYVDNSIKDIDSKTLRVKDKPIPALPSAEQRRNKQLGFDNEGYPQLLDPAETGSLGYVLVDSFEKGAEITTRYQALHWESNGEYYRWDGELPKIVSMKSTPENSGGVGNRAWVSIGDSSLRNDIGIIVKRYSNVKDMIDNFNGKKGDVIETLGYYDINDGGGSKYIIEEDNNTNSIADHFLKNNLKAVLVNYSLHSLGVFRGDDATEAINLMLEKGHPVYIDDEYIVNVDNDSSAIKLKPNSYIEWLNGGCLKLKPTNKEKYEVINFVGANNSMVIRPKLIGDRIEHIGNDGEWGHGLYITSCKNITIVDPDISQMFGDGICITSPIESDLVESEYATKNIKIINGVFNNCRRQGFSVTGGRDINFIGEQICKNIKGAPPEGAFDIEVNNFVPLKGLTINRVTGINCNGYTFNIFSNDGTRIMDNISIGSLISINGRRGALSVKATENSNIGLLKNIYISEIYQSVLDDYSGDLKAYDGFYFDRVKNINIGTLNCNLKKAVSNTLRCINGSSVFVNIFNSGGGRLIQCSAGSTFKTKTWNHSSGIESEQVYVSGSSTFSVGLVNVDGGNLNILCTDKGSLVEIITGIMKTKSITKDLYVRLTNSGAMTLGNVKFSVINSGSIIENSGELHCSGTDFGFGRVGATGVNAMSGSKTFLNNCIMLNETSNVNNAICIFNSGATGYAVGCISSDSNAIRILDGSSAISKGNINLF